MFLESLKITHLLSFGPDSMEISLQPLNLIIGPNGSGKSNFLEAISLLQSAPRDLNEPIRDAGGIREWLWKGGKKGDVAQIEAIIKNFDLRTIPLRHLLLFTESAYRFEMVQECIENRDALPGEKQPFFYYHFKSGRAWLNTGRKKRELKRETIHPEQSILSQRKDIDLYPEVTRLGELYLKIKLYREWGIGRFTSPRQPQDGHGKNDFLAEDYRNLGMVLNRLKQNIEAKMILLKYLNMLNGDIKDFDVIMEGGKVQVFFQEQNMAISATRLSDGTLRYLSLLAILCHPEPPPLVCIEEPELGLHPDILPSLAELLKEASKRMQLIVTTHSEILVDQFTDTPESVIVCEKKNMQTQMRRLERKELEDWLDEYGLGTGWTKGYIGGVRW
ncbi:MAG: AAA family ATPase [Magnetococcus sp. DMHC-6]